MRNVNYNGLPSIVGKTPQQALEILFRHCDESAQIMVAMNKEIEELKDEVEQLKFKSR